MSSSKQYTREQAQIEMFLGEIGSLLASQTGFVQRESKFDGNALVQVMSLGTLENGTASLTPFAQVAADLGIEISPSGIHQRLDMEAVELLSEVCRLWVQQPQSSAVREVLQDFPAVHVIDSSRIVLPPALASHFRGGRNPATLKVQLAYEYRSGRVEALQVEEGVCPDQRCELPEEISEAGDLVIFDLGSFHQERFARLTQQGVYFLSRLQSQVGGYEGAADPQSLDVWEPLQQVSHDVTMGEQAVYLGQRARVPVRLVYYRVPPQVAQERRRRAKQAAKKRNTTCSQAYLERLDWVFFITNVPMGWLSGAQVGVVYRVRWQIEVIFKVWKSEMDWDGMGHWRVARMLTQFYGRCLALLLFHRLLEKYHPEAD